MPMTVNADTGLPMYDPDVEEASDSDDRKAFAERQNLTPLGSDPEGWKRQRALEMAHDLSKPHDEVVARALAYLAFLSAD